MRPDGSERLSLILGDITRQACDAIVNAANPTLLGGGGVDGAIHRAGGPSILEECRAIRASMGGRLLPTGDAVITRGGNLRAKYVIHAVGPVWQGGSHGEPDLLANAYRNSLRLAAEQGLTSIAFPSISTGAYGYPTEQASMVALQAIMEFLAASDSIGKTVMVLHSDGDLQTYRRALAAQGKRADGSACG